ncbi:hypothetical protein L1887_12440 [Cichorium endivia]|nr:hypothetical protein L1887_12440 [Cichorium endivia]
MEFGDQSTTTVVDVGGRTHTGRIYRKKRALFIFSLLSSLASFLLLHPSRFLMLIPSSFFSHNGLRHCWGNGDAYDLSSLIPRELRLASASMKRMATNKLSAVIGARKQPSTHVSRLQPLRPPSSSSAAFSSHSPPAVKP